MKRIVLFFVLLCTITTLSAQRISRSYQNVSMSEVLRDLNQLSRKYIINFMYNDLEDYRVTTEIRHKSIPDALEQIIGFYPIRIIATDSVITVECTYKTDRHLTGTIVDEHVILCLRSHHGKQKHKNCRVSTSEHINITQILHFYCFNNIL